MKRTEREKLLAFEEMNDRVLQLITDYQTGALTSDRLLVSLKNITNKIVALLEESMQQYALRLNRALSEIEMGRLEFLSSTTESYNSVIMEIHQMLIKTASEQKIIINNTALVGWDSINTVPQELIELCNKYRFKESLALRTDYGWRLLFRVGSVPTHFCAVTSSDNIVRVRISDFYASRINVLHDVIVKKLTPHKVSDVVSTVLPGNLPFEKNYLFTFTISKDLLRKVVSIMARNAGLALFVPSRMVLLERLSLLKKLTPQYNKSSMQIVFEVEKDMLQTLLEYYLDHEDAPQFDWHMLVWSKRGIGFLEKLFNKSGAERREFLLDIAKKGRYPKKQIAKKRIKTKSFSPITN